MNQNSCTNVNFVQYYNAFLLESLDFKDLKEENILSVWMSWYNELLFFEAEF